MNKIKTVGVKELKNKLSAYLREVVTGTRILVTDRGEVIAELGQPGIHTGHDTATAAILRWKELNQIRLPNREKVGLAPTGVNKPEGLAASLIEEDRGA